MLFTILATVSRRAQAFTARCHFVVEAINYRPERHYMRGPGPKWRARNGTG
jgi:hypothetical protein